MKVQTPTQLLWTKTWCGFDALPSTSPQKNINISWHLLQMWTFRLVRLGWEWKAIIKCKSFIFESTYLNSSLRRETGDSSEGFAVVKKKDKEIIQPEGAAALDCMCEPTHSPVGCCAVARVSGKSPLPSSRKKAMHIELFTCCCILRGAFCVKPSKANCPG